MGQKTIAIIVALTGCVLLASTAVFFLPMHKLSFFTAYILRAMRIETHLLTVELDEEGSDFCRLINQFRPGTCNSGSYQLQDIQHRFCAPAVVAFYKQGCSGFQAAYILGLLLGGALVTNFLGLATACFVLYSYISAEMPKRKYRMFALFLIAASTLVVSTAVALYGIFVFQLLDDLRPTGLGVIGELSFKPGDGIGMSFGYFCCIGIVAVQFFMLLLSNWTKTGTEVGDDELEERKAWAAEAKAQEGYGAGGHAGQVLAQAQGQQAFGMQPPPGGYGGYTLAPAPPMLQPAPMLQPTSAVVETTMVTYGTAPVGALTPNNWESQPADLRRGPTYMPDRPPDASAV